MHFNDKKGGLLFVYFFCFVWELFVLGLFVFFVLFVCLFGGFFVCFCFF